MAHHQNWRKKISLFYSMHKQTTKKPKKRARIYANAHKYKYTHSSFKNERWSKMDCVLFLAPSLDTSDEIWFSPRSLPKRHAEINKHAYTNHDNWLWVCIRNNLLLLKINQRHVKQSVLMHHGKILYMSSSKRNDGWVQWQGRGKGCRGRTVQWGLKHSWKIQVWYLQCYSPSKATLSFPRRAGKQKLHPQCCFKQNQLLFVCGSFNTIIQSMNKVGQTCHTSIVKNGNVFPPPPPFSPHVTVSLSLFSPHYKQTHWNQPRKQTHIHGTYVWSLLPTPPTPSLVLLALIKEKNKSGFPERSLTKHASHKTNSFEHECSWVCVDTFCGPQVVETRTCTSKPKCAWYDSDKSNHKQQTHRMSNGCVPSKNGVFKIPVGRLAFCILSNLSVVRRLKGEFDVFTTEKLL